MQFYKKPKIFLILLLYFCNLHQVLNILKKKVTVLAYVLPNLKTAKNVVS